MTVPLDAKFSMFENRIKKVWKFCKRWYSARKSDYRSNAIRPHDAEKITYGYTDANPTGLRSFYRAYV